MEFLEIGKTDYAVFHNLLTSYYRDGEDAETPQEQIDGFIRYLYELCVSGKISGRIVLDDAPIGFVLWTVDSEDGPFSNKPGYGTILEIGVEPQFRGRGYGGKMVALAQSCMNVTRYYVCAYGPAESFWKKCGYEFSGETADNGLKIMVTGDDGGR